MVRPGAARVVSVVLVKSQERVKRLEAEVAGLLENLSVLEDARRRDAATSGAALEGSRQQVLELESEVGRLRKRLTEQDG